MIFITHKPYEGFLPFVVIISGKTRKQDVYNIKILKAKAMLKHGKD